MNLLSINSQIKAINSWKGPEHGLSPPILHGTGFILNLISRILTFFLVFTLNTCIHSQIGRPGILPVKWMWHRKTILLNLLKTEACPTAGLTESEPGFHVTHYFFIHSITCKGLFSKNHLILKWSLHLLMITWMKSTDCPDQQSVPLQHALHSTSLLSIRVEKLYTAQMFDWHTFVNVFMFH